MNITFLKDWVAASVPVEPVSVTRDSRERTADVTPTTVPVCTIM